MTTAAASLAVGLLTFGALLAGAVAAAPRAAAATDDGSAVTATAKEQDPDVADAPFPDLSVTVSQTEDLVSQGIRLTYSGGKKSVEPSSQNAGQNFLQVMQCWDDLRDAQGNLVLDQDGQRQPDRTTCQYGSVNVTQGQTRTTLLPSVDGADPRDVAAGYVYPGTSFFDPPQVWVPFRAVNGKTLAGVVDSALAKDPVTGELPNLVSNEFFGPYSTNELPWAGFGADGRGSATFETQTAMQAPGLGCGNPVTADDGSVTGQPCWLVVVPRGDHDAVTRVGNTASALMWQTWQHRLAVRLDFKPLGVRCALGAHEQQVQGSELVSLALQSWQPVVCRQPGGPIFNDVVSSEQDAAAKANGTGTAPLALVSRALDAATYGTEDDLTYAPLAVTGLTVAFAVDHRSDPINPPSADIQARDALPFTQMNLTPRLLAKLLTDSYRSAVPTVASVPYLDTNPTNLTTDPDFLAINPQWAGQSIYSVALSDVFVPLGTSDSAWTVWNYITADAAARDFLAGVPDPWGMRVNPWATTDQAWDATVNPPGISNEYPTTRFAKPDPSEGQLVPGNPQTTVDAIAWRPYALSFDQSGYWVLRGDKREIGWNTGASGGGSGVAQFTVNPRDYPGEQKVLGLTDTSSAAKYQVYTAALENPAGQFVAPTVESMVAAAAVMVPDEAQPQVRSFDPTSAGAQGAADAYPLTVPIYAATNPAGGDVESRAAAVALIRYAAGDGQTPGSDLGQLPPGYAPMPTAWRAQARAAADLIGATSVTTPTPTDAPPAEATETTQPDSVAAPPSSELPQESDVPMAPVRSGAPAASAPTPSPTGPPPPVVGAAVPDAAPVGAVGAAVPLSAAGGVLAAAAVPVMTRRRRVR